MAAVLGAAFSCLKHLILDLMVWDVSSATMACQCQSSHRQASLCVMEIMRHAGSDERCQDHYLSQHCHTPPRLPGVYWESVILGFQPSAAGTHTAHPSHCSPPRAPLTGHLGHTCNHVCHHHHCHGPAHNCQPEKVSAGLLLSRSPRALSRIQQTRETSATHTASVSLRAYCHCLTMIREKFTSDLCGACIAASM